LHSKIFDDEKQTFAVFVGDKNFRELMFETFIKSSYIEIKKVMEKKILEWLDEGFENQAEEMILAEFFINELYYKIYEQAKTKPISIESASLFKIFRLIL
jgi:dissimilatory sulfite reductase (desulfoviridin) alpha/beta subunit